MLKGLDPGGADFEPQEGHFFLSKLAFVESKRETIMLKSLKNLSDNFLMFFMSLGKYDDVIKIAVRIRDAFEDFIGEALEAGRGVPDSEREAEELVQPPGSIDTNFFLIFFPDRNKMKSFGHINFTKHFAGLDVAGEGVDVGELVGLGEGGLVELAKISTRPFRAIRLALEVESG